MGYCRHDRATEARRHRHHQRRPTVDACVHPLWSFHIHNDLATPHHLGSSIRNCERACQHHGARVQRERRRETEQRLPAVLSNIPSASSSSSSSSSSFCCCSSPTADRQPPPTTTNFDDQTNERTNERTNDQSAIQTFTEIACTSLIIKISHHCYLEYHTSSTMMYNFLITADI